jgi:hypothetical protein
MNSHPIVSLLLFATAIGSASAQSPITPGNLIVSRVGDGTSTLTSAATARFLDEYTPNGVFVQTIALPTSVVGPQRRLVDSGTATSNGFVTQSADGRYLLAAGYDAALGTTSITGSPSTTVNRVIARIGLDGTIDTTTALTDAYTGNNFRGVASVDGTSFWCSGTGTAPTPGVRFVAALGDSTSVQLSTTVTNIRCINIFGSQLHCSSASGAFQGVSSVGMGQPTTAGQSIDLLPGFPTTSGPSAYDFAFADADTLYVADDRTNGLGGIQKWTRAAGAWSLVYTLAPAASIGCRGLSLTSSNGVNTLYATTTSGDVVAATDLGAGSAFTTVVAAMANIALRDVQFVRTPASLGSVGTACPNNLGTPVLAGVGVPVTGNLGFGIDAADCGPSSLVVFVLGASEVLPTGVPVPGAPACALLFVLPDLLIADFATPLGTANVPLPIPANASIGGTIVGAQVAAFDLSLAGFDVPVGMSAALRIVVGN